MFVSLPSSLLLIQESWVSWVDNLYISKVYYNLKRLHDVYSKDWTSLPRCPLHLLSHHQASFGTKKPQHGKSWMEIITNWERPSVSCASSPLREQALSLMSCWRCSGSYCRGARAVERDSVVAVHRLSCCVAWGILPDQGSNPCPMHLAGRFLTAGPVGKSQTLKILKPQTCRHPKGPLSI